MRLNTSGLNMDRRKGSEAASQIKSAAITQDLLISIALPGRPTVSILSLLADKLASIDPGATYCKPEVNKCISAIKGASGFILGSSLTIMLDAACDLKADKTILDSPLPEL